jgi:hypothetical protein
LFAYYLHAQNVGVNSTGAAPNSSALLDIDAAPANDKGILIPRVALTSNTVTAPITNPEVSLLIYNTATAGSSIFAVTPGYYYWDGAAWIKFDTNPTPPGTVSAYMGTVAPNGWLLCDGSAISRTTYTVLFSIIGTASGNGNGTTTFNLPDMRGMFLRGVDGTAGNDPDKLTRTASNLGGNTGNAVGSKEIDAFQGHIHFCGVGPSGVPGPRLNGGSASGVAFFNNNYPTNNPQDNGINGTPRTGNETRPKNIYVNYIIKY